MNLGGTDVNIQINKIRFGDPDALHELTKQNTDQSRVFINSFVPPPRANFDQLLSGSRYLIVGPKGAGKTAALLFIRDNDEGHKYNLILFKSNIRNEDRSKLDKLTKIVVIEDQGKFKVETDYKTVWEWYLLKSMFRLLEESDILEGIDYFKDIVLLLEANKKKFNTLFDTMRVEGAKGSIRLKIGAGALQSEIGAEIEARRKGTDEIDFLDLVRLTQISIKNIKLKEGVKCRLYIDELEFFLEQDGNGERDRRMVRDLVFSVYSTNLLFAETGIDALCYACVRSEVIESFPGSSSELSKIIKSFSVHMNWEPIPGHHSAILDIFSRKITNSEIEETGNHCEDPWISYFPESVEGKDIKKYLLDMGSHRPRGVLLILMAAADRSWGRDKFIEQDFDDHDNNFANAMLDEFKDELSANLFDYEIDAVISLIRGRNYIFDVSDMNTRMSDAQAVHVIRKLRKNHDAESIVKIMYRCGLIGNTFRSEAGNHPRQTWAARGYHEPMMGKHFIVHQSLFRLLDLV